MRLRHGTVLTLLLGCLCALLSLSWYGAFGGHKGEPAPAPAPHPHEGLRAAAPPPRPPPPFYLESPPPAATHPCHGCTPLSLRAGGFCCRGAGLPSRCGGSGIGDGEIWGEPARSDAPKRDAGIVAPRFARRRGSLGRAREGFCTGRDSDNTESAGPNSRCTSPRMLSVSNGVTATFLHLVPRRRADLVFTGLAERGRWLFAARPAPTFGPRSRPARFDVQSRESLPSRPHFQCFFVTVGKLLFGFFNFWLATNSKVVLNVSDPVYISL